MLTGGLRRVPWAWGGSGSCWCRGVLRGKEGGGGGEALRLGSSDLEPSVRARLAGEAPLRKACRSDGVRKEARPGMAYMGCLGEHLGRRVRLSTLGLTLVRGALEGKQTPIWISRNQRG